MADTDDLDKDEKGELTRTQLARWQAIELLDEALVENEIIGNRTGARVPHYLDVPDEPAFNSWLADFCSRLPSYVSLHWQHVGNQRRAGYTYKGETNSIKLECSELVRSVSDIQPDPKEAVRVLLETYPVSK